MSPWENDPQKPQALSDKSELLKNFQNMGKRAQIEIGKLHQGLLIELAIARGLWEFAIKQAREEQKWVKISSLSEADLLALEEKTEGRNLINLILFRWSKYGFDADYIFFHNKRHLGIYYEGKSSLQEMNNKEKQDMLDQFSFRQYREENDYERLCKYTQEYLENKWKGARNLGMPFGNWFPVPDRAGEKFETGTMGSLYATRKYFEFIKRCMNETKKRHQDWYNGVSQN